MRFLSRYVSVAPTWSNVSSASTWEDWDLSSIVGTNAKIAEIVIKVTVQADIGVRPNGSTLDRKWTATGSTSYETYITMQVELDSDKIVERYAGSTTDVSFAVVGYWE